ncbi:MAG: hypothetical protein AUI14_07825 [Actinobacteria bacterium 13_2_20CM_2_71_6]|nr:MAG: hypothetical protein AUI14_07825 [Actinobacteria bacterium 13_2_20CM_2_71_6]
MVAGIFLDAAAAVAPLLRTRELADGWSRPSALAEFRISGLAGHLARAVFNVERYLEAPVPPDAPMLNAVTYFQPATGLDGRDPTDDVHRIIRERGEQDAAGGPEELADRYDATRARLAVRLAELPDDRPVLMFGRVLPLGECVVTRLVELAVHTDDLAVSLGLPTPDIGEQASDLVIATLGLISRRRHGTLPVLRALSRRERAPADVAAF